MTVYVVVKTGMYMITETLVFAERFLALKHLLDNDFTRHGSLRLRNNATVIAETYRNNQYIASLFEREVLE